MLKEVLLVAGAAGAGEFLVRKFGTSIEAKLVQMKIPPTVGHAAVVGGFAAIAFLAARAIF